MNSHALDEATRLTHHGDGPVTGHSHPAYANVVGPFGGITAATLLKAALTHPERLGDPVAFTVNYAGPVAEGEFQIEARPLRTNRSTQHWSIVQTQAGEVVTSATAVFALRRETWTSTEVPMPDAPPADDVPVSETGSFVAWPRNYEMRFVGGSPLTRTAPVEERDAITTVWIRDQPPRPLDFTALASLCDAFFPRIFVRRPMRVPFGTVSLTAYFHADTALLDAQGSRPLLAHARATHFGRGYHDQTVDLWSDTGNLLATSHQVVYFKE